MFLYYSLITLICKLVKQKPTALAQKPSKPTSNKIKKASSIKIFKKIKIVIFDTTIIVI